MTSSAVSRPRTTSRPSHAGRRPMTRVAAPPAEQRVAGRYRHDLHDGVWRWSPELFTLHGLAPGSVEPTVELLLRHQHPEDLPRVVEALSAACSAAQAFALETRLLRADGAQRTVVLMGEPDLDPTGQVRAVEGMCLDLTAARAPGPDAGRLQSLEVEVVQLRAAMASRAAIEQAKGILMLLTNCGDQPAFELLTHISSHTHRKVRDVAQTITESAAGRVPLPADMRAILRDACPPAQPSD